MSRVEVRLNGSLTETGLHIEVTIDETSTKFFVAEMISGTKLMTDEIVAVVKNMPSTARRLS